MEFAKEILPMSYLPSRQKYQNCCSARHLVGDLRKEFRKYKYELCIYLDLSGEFPVYSFLKIKTSLIDDDSVPAKSVIIIKRELSDDKKADIVSKLSKDEQYVWDTKHLGELLFILASKLKYDMLCGHKNEDNAGFLHTEEIIALNPLGNEAGDKRASIGKSLYRTLYKLKSDPKGKHVLQTLFEKPQQLFHILCYLGGIRKTGENYLWWLNVLPVNIEYRRIDNDKQISLQTLKPQLKNLFEGYILEDAKRSCMVKNIEGILDLHRKQANRQVEHENEYVNKCAFKNDHQCPIVESQNKIGTELDLCIPIMQIDPRKKQNLFRYEYQWAPFVGRDKEIDRISKFVGYNNEKLLWWSITGKGGVGKSRLALRMCIQLKEEGWQAGFLQDVRQLEYLKQWQPSTPHFIVIDYSCNDVKRVGEFFGALVIQDKSQNAPIRILFLDRTEKSDVQRQFYSANKRVLENLRYDCLRAVEEEPSLRLRSMDDESIQQITKEIFKNLKGRDPNEDEMKNVAFMQNKLRENNPLYAMFVADACARAEVLIDLDKKQLIEEVLRHYQDVWMSSGIDDDTPEGRKNINLLALTTMVNGINIDEYSICLKKYSDSAEILPLPYAMKHLDYEILYGEKVTKRFPPLTPDILGECFILERWQKYEYGMRFITEIAWNYKSRSAVEFITRLVQDFPDEKKVDDLINRVLKLSKFAYEKSVLISNLVSCYGRVNRLDMAKKYFEHMNVLWQQNKNDLEVSIQLARAGFYLIHDYYDANESIKYYEWINNALASHTKDDVYIALFVAKAGFCLVYDNQRCNNIDRSKQVFDEMYNLWEKHSYDEYISLQVVKAGKCLICDSRDSGNIEIAKNVYRNLLRVGQLHTADKYIPIKLSEIMKKMSG